MARRGKAVQPGGAVRPGKAVQPVKVVRRTVPSRSAPAAVLAAPVAVVCAVIVAVGTGPVRVLAGAALTLCLPGVLAWLALSRGAGPPRPDRVLGATLTVPLSLVATAVAGLLAAATGWGLRPGLIAAVLAVECAGLALVAAWPTWVDVRPGPLAAVTVAGPSRARPTGTGPVQSRPWQSLLAALPALALTAALVVAVAASTRHRTPDSYHTEFAVEASGSVTVHSRERTSTRFRLEIRVDGVLSRSAGFTLRPGERRAFPGAVAPSGRAEARLYRGDEPTPYRRLTL